MIDTGRTERTEREFVVRVVGEDGELQTCRLIYVYSIETKGHPKG